MKNSKYLILLLLLPPIGNSIVRLVRAQDTFNVSISIIPFVVLAGFAILGFVQYFDAKSSLNNALSNKSDRVPVKYSTDDVMKGVRLFYFHSFGWLLFTGDQVIFRSGTRKITFSPETSKLAWVGEIWKAGAIDWICMIENGKKYYFTYDTGYTVFFSQVFTKKLFDFLVTKKFSICEEPNCISSNTYCNKCFVIKKKCPNCGKNIDNRSTACLYCGASVKFKKYFGSDEITGNKLKSFKTFKTKKCISCGELIDKRATICLSCGEPTTN